MTVWLIAPRMPTANGLISTTSRRPQHGGNRTGMTWVHHDIDIKRSRHILNLNENHNSFKLKWKTLQKIIVVNTKSSNRITPPRGHTPPPPSKKWGVTGHMARRARRNHMARRGRYECMTRRGRRDCKNNLRAFF